MKRFVDFLVTDFSTWRVEFRIHATQRMYQRDISQEDLLFALSHGIIIEEYGEDYPFPSMLVNGRTKAGRPLHVVPGIDFSEKRMYIITVYEPDSKKWTEDFSRRI